MREEGEESCRVKGCERPGHCWFVRAALSAGARRYMDGLVGGGRRTEHFNFSPQFGFGPCRVAHRDLRSRYRLVEMRLCYVPRKKR